MADFYLDHDVSARLVPLLQQSGHNVLTAHGLGLQRAPDPIQLYTAAQRNAILVTHNQSDFQLLHIAWQYWSTAWGVPKQHAGILILPHGPAQQSLQRLLAFVASGLPMPNECYRYSRQLGWMRYG